MRDKSMTSVRANDFAKKPAEVGTRGFITAYALSEFT